MTSYNTTLNAFSTVDDLDRMFRTDYDLSGAYFDFDDDAMMPAAKRQASSAGEDDLLFLDYDASPTPVSSTASAYECFEALFDLPAAAAVTKSILQQQQASPSYFGSLPVTAAGRVEPKEEPRIPHVGLASVTSRESQHAQFASAAALYRSMTKAVSCAAAPAAPAAPPSCQPTGSSSGASLDPASRKRERNRLAAERCRQRKTDLIDTLQKECEELRVEREKLLLENAKLLRALGLI